jgi:hypothetical protein
MQQAPLERIEIHLGEYLDEHVYMSIDSSRIDNEKRLIDETQDIQGLKTKCLSLLVQTQESEKLERFSSCQTAYMYLLLYRCRKQLEDRIQRENRSLSRKQIIAAIRNTLGEDIANNNRRFKIFLNKCRRGEKVTKIVEIVGNGILQRHQIFWSKIYKLQQQRFEELIEMVTFFYVDPTLSDQLEQEMLETVSNSLADEQEQPLDLNEPNNSSEDENIEYAGITVPETEMEQNGKQSDISDFSNSDEEQQIEFPENEFDRNEGESDRSEVLEPEDEQMAIPETELDYLILPSSKRQRIFHE